MSKYTTQVRFICETYAGYNASVDYPDVKTAIDKSWEKIFEDFPIWDEEYRSVLCKKILMHYYTREIGLETVGLWKLKLNTKMNEIMPYFNQMYKTSGENLDFLRDADYYREHSGKDSGSNNATSGSSGKTDSVGRHAFSDTPQGSLSNIENNTYLTNASKDTLSSNNSVDSEQKGEYSNTDEYLDHVYGKMPGKTYASMIKEYRAILINIDMMIIEELSELFLKLW